MTAPKAKAEQPAPPPAAVAADAHWAAKMARLRSRQLPERTLKICDDEDLKEALGAAQWAQRRLVTAAEMPAGEEVPADLQAQLDAAAAAVAAAQEAVDAATIPLLFRGLPRPDYEALIKAHPPTEKQGEDGDGWNVDTFAPALISAASVDGMPPEDAEFFLATWAPAEATALFNAAFSVQQVDRTDLGKG